MDAGSDGEMSSTSSGGRPPDESDGDNLRSLESRFRKLAKNMMELQKGMLKMQRCMKTTDSAIRDVAQRLKGHYQAVKYIERRIYVLDNNLRELELVKKRMKEEARKKAERGIVQERREQIPEEDVRECNMHEVNCLQYEHFLTREANQCSIIDTYGGTIAKSVPDCWREEQSTGSELPGITSDDPCSSGVGCSSTHQPSFEVYQQSSFHPSVAYSHSCATPCTLSARPSSTAIPPPTDTTSTMSSRTQPTFMSQVVELLDTPTTSTVQETYEKCPCSGSSARSSKIVPPNSSYRFSPKRRPSRHGVKIQRSLMILAKSSSSRRHLGRQSKNKTKRRVKRQPVGRITSANTRSQQSGITLSSHRPLEREPCPCSPLTNKTETCIRQELPQNRSESVPTQRTGATISQHPGSGSNVASHRIKERSVSIASGPQKDISCPRNITLVTMQCRRMPIHRSRVGQNRQFSGKRSDSKHTEFTQDFTERRYDAAKPVRHDLNHYSDNIKVDNGMQVSKNKSGAFSIALSGEYQQSISRPVSDASSGGRETGSSARSVKPELLNPSRSHRLKRRLNYKSIQRNEYASSSIIHRQSTKKSSKPSSTTPSTQIRSTGSTKGGRGHFSHHGEKLKQRRHPESRGKVYRKATGLTLHFSDTDLTPGLQPGSSISTSRKSRLSRKSSRTSSTPRISTHVHFTKIKKNKTSRDNRKLESRRPTGFPGRIPTNRNKLPLSLSDADSGPDTRIRPLDSVSVSDSKTVDKSISPKATVPASKSIAISARKVKFPHSTSKWHASNPEKIYKRRPTGFYKDHPKKKETNVSNTGSTLDGDGTTFPTSQDDTDVQVITEVDNDSTNRDPCTPDTSSSISSITVRFPTEIKKEWHSKNSSLISQRRPTGYIGTLPDFLAERLSSMASASTSLSDKPTSSFNATSRRSRKVSRARSSKASSSTDSYKYRVVGKDNQSVDQRSYRTTSTQTPNILGKVSTSKSRGLGTFEFCCKKPGTPIRRRGKFNNSDNQTTDFISTMQPKKIQFPPLVMNTQKCIPPRRSSFTQTLGMNPGPYLCAKELISMPKSPRSQLKPCLWCSNKRSTRVMTPPLTLASLRVHSLHRRIYSPRRRNSYNSTSSIGRGALNANRGAGMRMSRISCQKDVLISGPCSSKASQFDSSSPDVPGSSSDSSYLVGHVSNVPPCRLSSFPVTGDSTTSISLNQCSRKFTARIPQPREGSVTSALCRNCPFRRGSPTPTLTHDNQQFFIDVSPPITNTQYTAHNIASLLEDSRPPWRHSISAPYIGLPTNSSSSAEHTSSLMSVTTADKLLSTALCRPMSCPRFSYAADCVNSPVPASQSSLGLAASVNNKCQFLTPSIYPSRKSMPSDIVPLLGDGLPSEHWQSSPMDLRVDSVKYVCPSRASNIPGSVPLPGGTCRADSPCKNRPGALTDIQESVSSTLYICPSRASNIPESVPLPGGTCRADSPCKNRPGALTDIQESVSSTLYICPSRASNISGSVPLPGGTCRTDSPCKHRPRTLTDTQENVSSTLYICPQRTPSFPGSVPLPGGTCRVDSPCKHRITALSNSQENISLNICPHRASSIPGSVPYPRGTCQSESACKNPPTKFSGVKYANNENYYNISQIKTLDPSQSLWKPRSCKRWTSQGTIIRDGNSSELPSTAGHLSLTCRVLPPDTLRDQTQVNPIDFERSRNRVLCSVSLPNIPKMNHRPISPIDSNSEFQGSDPYPAGTCPVESPCKQSNLSVRESISSQLSNLKRVLQLQESIEHSRGTGTTTSSRSNCSPCTSIQYVYPSRCELQESVLHPTETDHPCKPPLSNDFLPLEIRGETMCAGGIGLHESSNKLVSSSLAARRIRSMRSVTRRETLKPKFSHYSPCQCQPKSLHKLRRSTLSNFKRSPKLGERQVDSGKNVPSSHPSFSWQIGSLGAPRKCRQGEIRSGVRMVVNPVETHTNFRDPSSHRSFFPWSCSKKGRSDDTDFEISASQLVSSTSTTNIPEKNVCPSRKVQEEIYTDASKTPESETLFRLSAQGASFPQQPRSFWDNSTRLVCEGRVHPPGSMSYDERIEPTSMEKSSDSKFNKNQSVSPLGSSQLLKVVPRSDDTYSNSSIIDSPSKTQPLEIFELSPNVVAPDKSLAPPRLSHLSSESQHLTATLDSDPYPGLSRLSSVSRLSSRDTVTPSSFLRSSSSSAEVGSWNRAKHYPSRLIICKAPGPAASPPSRKYIALLGKLLMNAAHKGRAEDVRRLLDMGAEVNVTNSLKWTPLHRAAAKAQSDVIELLLTRGADANAKTSYGLTALHLAAHCDRSGRSISRLVAGGASVDSWSRFGRTPLHAAAEKGNITAVAALMEAGASSIAKDDQGKTPYDLTKSPCVKRLLTGIVLMTSDVMQQNTIKSMSRA